MTKFRRGEDIPELDIDEPGEEDENEPEIEDLESEEEAEDSELCLAGQALEREFLSEEDWVLVPSPFHLSLKFLFDLGQSRMVEDMYLMVYCVLVILQ